MQTPTSHKIEAPINEDEVERIVTAIEAFVEEERREHAILNKLIEQLTLGQASHSETLLQLHKIVNENQASIRIIINHLTDLSVQKKKHDGVFDLLENVKNNPPNVNKASELAHVQTLGIRIAIAFVFMCPLMLIIFSYADHVATMIMYQDKTPWIPPPEVMWVCLTAIFAITAWGFKVGGVNMFDVLALLKGKPGAVVNKVVDEVREHARDDKS